MANIETINPATNKLLDTHELHTEKQIKEAIDNAYNTWKSWHKSTFDHRAGFMEKAADTLERNKSRYVEMMTAEMGKVNGSAEAEVGKCAWVCRYYAENAEKFLTPEHIKTDASKSYISYQALGVILAVMPWNFPFWQVFRFAAPALMAGNVGILKHASNVPGCAKLIEEVFHDAGFPSGSFTSLIVSSKSVSKIIEHPLVMAATLTGSEYAGAAVASACGKQIKKSVLELGGSDPYLILADADLSLAVEHCTISRLLNAGQSCIGAKRFLVVKEIYNEFLERFHKRMSRAVIGEPHDKVDLGPMARHDLRDEVHKQVRDSVAAGAKLVLGGEIPDSEGAYYPPTILIDVRPGMPAYDEEIFGPVASVIKVSDEAEAIRIANDSKFGLGAAVYTKDIEKGERIAREELQAGCCFVNQFVKSDPRLPFGGIKTSGYGRELSYLGIREFVNIKTVYVA